MDNDWEVLDTSRSKKVIQTVMALLIATNIFFIKQLVDELQRDGVMINELKERIVAVETKLSLLYERDINGGK